MVYVMSDLHGCWESYGEMLRKIRFSDADTLYVLGDVMDRGPEPFRILLDMADRPNVIGLLGNHDLGARWALPAFIRTAIEGKKKKAQDLLELHIWEQEGGKSSMKEFVALSTEDRERSLAALDELPLWKEIEVGGRTFLLTHSGLDHFDPKRPLDEYETDDLVWCRPAPDDVYYPDKTVVFGHTPTRLFRTDPGPVCIFHTDTWIDIDCGCVYRGGRLGCLCLDTMEEFYV